MNPDLDLSNLSVFNLTTLMHSVYDERARCRSGRDANVMDCAMRHVFFIELSEILLNQLSKRRATNKKSPVKDKQERSSDRKSASDEPKQPIPEKNTHKKRKSGKQDCSEGSGKKKSPPQEPTQTT